MDGLFLCSFQKAKLVLPHQPKTGSTATCIEPWTSRKAEVENAERLKTEVMFNPQPFCLILANYG
jgi:hypothetical protein